MRPLWVLALNAVLGPCSASTALVAQQTKSDQVPEGDKPYLLRAQ